VFSDERHLFVISLACAAFTRCGLFYSQSINTSLDSVNVGEDSIAAYPDKDEIGKKGKKRKKRKWWLRVSPCP